MIQPVLFAALMITAGGILLHAVVWTIRYGLPILRQYKIVKRGEHQ